MVAQFPCHDMRLQGNCAKHGTINNQECNGRDSLRTRKALLMNTAVLCFTCR